MKKHIYQFILPKRVFRQFVDRKVVGLNAKILPACSNARDTSLISIFSLRKIKMSK